MTQGRKKGYTPSASQLRHLAQYKDMTDEEFDDFMNQKLTNSMINEAFESQIQKKIDKFGEDYDLDDLKANDYMNLRALAQAYITLDDLEKMSFELRSGESLDDKDILKFDKLNMTMNTVRNAISKFQDDLNITRKIRKGDKEASVVNYLEELKAKAKEFYEMKHLYIFCPKCNMLLATIWLHYPEEAKNKIQLVCNRILDTGEICGNKLQISPKELLEMGGVNIEDVPEFFK